MKLIEAVNASVLAWLHRTRDKQATRVLFIEEGRNSVGSPITIISYAHAGPTRNVKQTYVDATLVGFLNIVEFDPTEEA